MVTLPAVGRAVSARLELPGSKSLTNRMLPLAAVAEGVSRLRGVLLSDDSGAMVDALCGLGFAVDVSWPALEATVSGSSGCVPASEAVIFCGEGATVVRFLLALCAAGHGVYRFDGGPSLRRRPLGPLLRAIQALGGEVSAAGEGRLPLTLRARGLPGGRLALDSSTSSQYLSALLMALPLGERPAEVTTEVTISEPYVDMTRSVMAEFGIESARPAPDRYLVPAPQTARAAALTIEADASTASYFFAAAAVTGGRVTVTNLSRARSRQGDVRFLDVLERMGCDVVSDDATTTVTGPDRLRGVDADFGPITDTFMTLACLAPFADRPTTIRGIAHTRLKESDRISATLRNLTALGVRAQETADGIRIEPGKPAAGTVDAFLDHRQVMSFAVLGLRTPGVTVLGADCVAKTCPGFFDLWQRCLEDRAGPA
jgi:3-phosphoshikimate 1-carboxyvinyltransferase